jgi:histidine triad (HIT) family protein
LVEEESLDNCIFCKIVAGEFGTELIAESKHAIAFKDISPRKPIHVLVVPKEHHRDVSELSASNPAALADLVALGCRVAEQLSTGSFRLTFNTGEAAGQTVFHAHGHITSTTPKAASAS